MKKISYGGNIDIYIPEIGDNYTIDGHIDGYYGKGIVDILELEEIDNSNENKS